MKTAIISDVHGNYPALEAVLSAAEGVGCKNVLCLGDTAGYYPMINECVKALQEVGAVSLRGNHDCYLLGEFECPRSRSARRCIEYQKSVVSDESLEWLRGAVRTLSKGTLFAMHGGLNDPIDEYVLDFDFEMALQMHPKKKVFLSGHTHVQVLQTAGEIVYCNPGSVGQPRDHDKRAAFAILDGKSIELKRVEYDIERIAHAMANAGFSEHYYENLHYGLRIGENV